MPTLAVSGKRGIVRIYYLENDKNPQKSNVICNWKDWKLSSHAALVGHGGSVNHMEFMTSEDFPSTILASASQVSKCISCEYITILHLIFFGYRIKVCAYGV